jgi:hypothetical protein
MEQVKHHLANLIAYAIDYFTNIQKNTEKTKSVKQNLEFLITSMLQKSFWLTKNSMSIEKKVS